MKNAGTGDTVETAKFLLIRSNPTEYQYVVADEFIVKPAGDIVFYTVRRTDWKPTKAYATGTWKSVEINPSFNGS